MRFAKTLAAGALFGVIGLGAVSASAAPAMPQPGLVAGDTVEPVRHRGFGNHHDHAHVHLARSRTTKRERRMRRQNTMRHGNSNARNPERPGYQQQLGNTTNGPRY